MSQTLSAQYVVRIGAALLATLCWVAAGTTVAAQETPPDTSVPLVDRPYEEIREFNGEPILPLNPAERSLISRLVREGALSQPDREILDKAIRLWIAELTWPENRTQLWKKRDTIKKQYLNVSGRQATDSTVHTYLNNAMLAGLTPIAKDPKYHPATRYTAVLIIGSLDATEPDIRGEGGRPMPEALSVLSDLLLDAKQLPSIQIAALLGIQRYAESKVTLSQPVAKALVGIVGSKAPPEGGSPSGHLWMRRRAAQILGVLGARDAPELVQADAVQALVALAGDTDATVPARVDALTALSAFGKASFAKVNAKQLAVDSAGILEAISKAAENEEMKPDWLAYYFSVVLNALRGTGERGLTKSTDDAAARQWFAELSARADDLLKAATERNTNPAAIRRQIASKARDLQRWIEGKRGELSVAGGGGSTSPGGQ